MKNSKNRLHNVLIIGATPAGVAAANKLGELGVPITLVDREANLDRKLSDAAYRLDNGVPFNFVHRPGLIRILRNNNIRCLLPAEIHSIKHSQQGFRIRIDQPATYVDAKRCTLCGRCVEVCPVSGLDRRQPIVIDDRMALPGRAVIDKRRQPLCQAGCPLGVNVQGYMALVAAGRYDEALELIRQNNVLPAVCGRICTHPCEAACRRGEKDGALAIRDIKRFVAEKGSTGSKPSVKEVRSSKAETIGIVGSGPAGLAAAADLARQGYEVTIYEKENAAGGLLRYGVGPHRLPRDVLDAEIAAIQTEGVKIVTSHPVAMPDGLLELRNRHQAVIVTTGSWADRRLGAEGETLKGVEGCLAFLNRFYRNEVQSLPGETAVIGDGNAAFDLARVLRRLGATVSIISWFAREEIPADADEVEAALAEGVTILDRRQVAAFQGSDGRLQSLQLQSTQPGPPDARGICWPVPVENGAVTEHRFDRAFVAIGQAGAYTHMRDTGGLGVDGRGLLTVDEQGRTPMDGIYAAGDAATGATSVVQAMADGRRVAFQVMRDMDGDLAVKKLQPLALRPENRDFDPIAEALPVQSRAVMPEIPADQRRSSFAEVVLGLGETQAQAEAARCLQCGGCAQCLACLPACDANLAIRHDARPETFFENAGVVIVADPEMAPGIKGDDVIRAYGPPSARNDMHAMVLRGFAAAARAVMLLQRNGMPMKGRGVAFVPPDAGLDPQVRIGVFACRCNSSFGWSDEMDAFLQELTHQQPDVVHTEVLPSACIPEGIQRIVDTVRDKGLTRLVVASCACCPLNFVCSACTDQRSRLKRGLFEGTGVSRSMVQMCNLRGEVLRHLITDKDLAVRLFKGIVTRSIGRARKLLPFPAPARRYNFTTAVIGQTEAATSAALTMAQAGFEVLMFGSAKHPLDQAPVHPLIYAFEGSTVDAVSGTLGNFQVHAHGRDGARTFTVGGVILGEKSRNIAIYRQHDHLPGVKVQARMQKEAVTGIPYMYPGGTSISGLFLADPPGIQISKRTKGEAVAILAAAAMPRGPRQSRGFSVVVNEALCRGCGRCLKTCPYQAVNLKPNDAGGFSAEVDDALCKGCGNCISVCPSNAADSPFRDQAYLEHTLEELLATGSRS